AVKEAPGAVVEPGRKAAKLGGICSLAARHLTEKARAQDHALRSVLPIDPHDDDRRVVIEPRTEIVLGDRGRGKRAVHIEVRDGKPELVLDGGCREPGCRLVSHAFDPEIPIVIGEAENGAVLPFNPPTMAERGDAAREMGGKAGVERLHSLTSIRLICGTIC